MNETLITEGQKYFTGYPCLRCGGARRYVSNRKCVTCQIKARTDQHRANPLENVEEKMEGVWYGK